MVGDYVHVSPGITLRLSIHGSSYLVSVGSVVSNNLDIASGCTVGAGAVVIADILEQGTYVGVPAKRIK